MRCNYCGGEYEVTVKVGEEYLYHGEQVRACFASNSGKMVYVIFLDDPSPYTRRSGFVYPGALEPIEEEATSDNQSV
jgi:hypothetical protein